MNVKLFICICYECMSKTKSLIENDGNKNRKVCKQRKPLGSFTTQSLNCWTEVLIQDPKGFKMIELKIMNIYRCRSPITEIISF